MTDAGQGRRAGRLSADAGFTLVEVMAAVVVFVIVSTATTAILIQALRVIRDNSDRVMASSIARAEVEYLRTLGTTAIPIGLTIGAVPSGQSAARVDPRLLDPNFTIRTTSNWVGLNQTQTACTAAAPGQAYMRVTVEVSSKNLGRPVSVDTVIFPENVYQVTGSGSATIALIDQVGSPVSDVLVRGIDTFHPTNNFTVTTGTDGCLFIPNLVSTGSLAVTVSRSGYVSQTPTGTQAVLSITSGNVSRSSFKMAAAATVQFASEDATYTIPAAMPVRWQFNTTGASATDGTLGSPATGLWPEPSGLTVFAGRCPSSDPVTHGVSRQSFALDAGGTSVAVLASAPVRVRGLTADLPVTARFLGAPVDSSCTVPSMVVGRSNAQGVLKVGLPYGNWEFTAGGQTHALIAPLVPLPDGTTPPPAVVAFTLANLDDPCPSPSATATPTATPTGTPSPSPSPTGTTCPSPSATPS